ncbi:MAG: carboxypeptidase-like regulatory domain-containing protein, partial [Chitinophagaceae bacterium]|nr:carboxypeptidase-like regulatory domain-containing protein [Chitinophagaceae bacterium]
MFSKSLLFSLAMFCFQAVFSQGFTVRGSIRNIDSKRPVSQATVSLQSVKSSTNILNVISDTSGNFELATVPNDTFNLKITALNYATLTRQIVVSNADVNLGQLDLQRVSGVLKGVTVTTNVSRVSQKADTLQLNANQFKVNPDATIEDLAKKMPGITIENGVVKAQGENVQRVTIDGRELFGEDATAALRNLPAEIVDKIQIFDRLSDQAQFTGVDDGNTTKGLNIVTKANMRNGQFGRVYAGLGTDGRYTAGGNSTLLKENRKISFVGNFNNVNQQNFSAQDLLGVTSSGTGGRGGNFRAGGGAGGRGGGGNFGGGGNTSNFLVGQQNGINKTNAAGINYTDNWGKKMIVTGSYFYNNTNNNTNELVNRQYFLKGIPSYNQNTLSVSNNTNHRVNLRFEYRIDSANQLIITPAISIQQNRSDRSVETSFIDAATIALKNRTKNINSSDRSGNNLNNSIFYRHSFKKRGRTFSINLNTSSNTRSGEVYTNLFDTTFRASSYYDSTSRRFTDQSNNGYNLSTNLIYTEPVSKNTQLQFSYNPGYSSSKADQEAYQYELNSNKYSVFDPALSSKFNNT